jgi:hypothetical protein
MPFGRYRGCELHELPEDYLHWLLGLEDLRASLRAAVEREIERREDARHARTMPRERPCPAPDLAEQIIGAGFRAVSRRVHPDVGGTHEQMIAASAAADWLRSAVRGLAC